MCIRRISEHDASRAEEEREKREKKFSNDQQKGRREEKGREEKRTVIVVWKNVRKIRTREKQINGIGRVDEKI